MKKTPAEGVFFITSGYDKILFLQGNTANETNNKTLQYCVLGRVDYK
jgi:hypothetical protein